LGNARHEGAQAQEERTQDEPGEQEREKILRDSQEEQKNAERGQRTEETSYGHEHLGDDERPSDTPKPVREERYLPTKAGACGRTQHRRACERVAEQALYDHAPDGQRGTCEKRGGQSIATQLQKRIAKLRIGEVARSDEHGEHSGDEQQKKQ
jgi:hypothetical protein